MATNRHIVSKQITCMWNNDDVHKEQLRTTFTHACVHLAKFVCIRIFLNLSVNMNTVKTMLFCKMKSAMLNLRPNLSFPLMPIHLDVKGLSYLLQDQ